MAHAISGRPLTHGVRVNPRTVYLEWWRLKRHWHKFVSKYFKFPCQYHSTNAPYESLHLSPKLHNLSNSIPLHNRHTYCDDSNDSLFTHWHSQVCWRKGRVNTMAARNTNNQLQNNRSCFSRFPFIWLNNSESVEPRKCFFFSFKIFTLPLLGLAARGGRTTRPLPQLGRVSTLTQLLKSLQHMRKASFKESNLVEVIYDLFSFYIMLLMFFVDG